MSGGSFDYLCYVDVEELPNRLGSLERMADALGEYPDGHAASVDTHELIAIIQTAMRRVEARQRRLGPLWHAVEWHRSADYGPDQVAAALKAYYGESGESVVSDG